MKLTKNQINDFKVWFKPGGDKDFSPEHNKAVVEGSIKEYDLRRLKAQKMFNEAFAERADAVASLLKAIDTGKETNALKYFGKKELARLRGDQIIGEVRVRLASMQKHNAKTKLSN